MDTSDGSARPDHAAAGDDRAGSDDERLLRSVDWLVARLPHKNYRHLKPCTAVSLSHTVHTEPYYTIQYYSLSNQCHTIDGLYSQFQEGHVMCVYVCVRACVLVSCET